MAMIAQDIEKHGYWQDITCLRHFKNEILKY